jgi:HEAT repeat protein
MPPKRKISLSDLEEALKSAENSVRYNAIYDFSRSNVTMEAVPALLQALNDTNPGVVRCAADSLGKLGPATLNYGSQTGAEREVVWKLIMAASHVDTTTLMPQAYPDCLAALVRIAPQSFLVLALIHNFIGLDNWYPLKASLIALRTIGTPQALDLLKRAIDFWWPELDKKQRRIVERIAKGEDNAA